MAKYYSSTFGKISGKHGNAVAVIRKDGSTYLRLHVPAGNPRTDKQQAHRAKFALTSKSLVPFNPIFKETIGVTNGISTARSHAFKNAIVGEFPNLSVDYEKVMFSFGVLEGLQDASVVINEGAMNVSWGFKKMYNCHKNDSVNFVIFNKNMNQTIHIKDAAVRSDRGVNIDIDDSWVNDDLYLWAYVTRGDKISNSVYVSKCSIAINSDEDDHQESNDVLISDLCGKGAGVNAHYTSSSHIASAILPLYNSSIVSFIIMLYNMLKLFIQSVVASTDISILNMLINKYFNIMKVMCNADGARVVRLNKRSYQKGLYNVFYSKYQSIYTLDSIGVMNC